MTQFLTVNVPPKLSIPSAPFLMVRPEIVATFDRGNQNKSERHADNRELVSTSPNRDVLGDPKLTAGQGDRATDRKSN